MAAISNETILARLQELHGDKVLKSEQLYDMLTITVEKEALYEVVKTLKEDPQLNFHFLTTLCGLDYPDTAQRFGLMVQLHNMLTNTRVRLKAFTGDHEPSFKSLTSLWPAANWMEREAYDFFGFRFHGHPDMRRILNMDSLEGWPLRKEYPLEDPFRLDKDDKMFGR
jgi:NADH-quinone oxidoreductase subunit C